MASAAGSASGSALPVPSTNTTMVGWVPESPGRGTLTLITTCLLTMFICTWVVIHRRVYSNVSRGEFHKAAMFLKAIVAPEFIAVEGLQEWSQARKMVRDCAQFKDDQGNSMELIHTFYISMLALRYRTSRNTARIIWPNQYVWLLRNGLIDWKDHAAWGLSKRDIKDKSNTDGFAKATALVQVFWFLAQCIIRAVHHLPLAPLESMTISYIPLFAATYFFWWFKPKDIMSPSDVDLPAMTSAQREEFESLAISYDFDDEGLPKQTSWWNIWALTPRVFEKEYEIQRKAELYSQNYAYQGDRKGVVQLEVSETVVYEEEFAPFASDIDLAFFSSLAYRKINFDKLDTSARPVLGVYEIQPNDSPENSCRIQVGPTALTAKETAVGQYRAEGYIRNVNTIEEFKKANYSDIIQRSGRTIWEAILDGSIYSIPSLLASFTIISFADLKKYHFHYWCGFPAIHSAPPWTVVERWKFSEEESVSLCDTVSTWRYGVDSRQRGFFLFKRVKPATGDSETVWTVAPLGEYEQGGGFFSDVKDMKKDAFVAFADPSNFDEHPGWPLRNLLVLIRKRWKLREVNIVGYRDVHALRHFPRSVIWTMRDDSEPDLSELSLKDTPLPKITGWERNRDKRLSPRFADLSQMMDPTRLADSAVDLNNRLMKWRIAPELNLDKIKETKCLLLGSGTLGAYVSRILLGWGVHKITFVDNANVSYSNPVRQPLFTFEDCQNGGKPKAARAAEALREIYPNVDSQGFKMQVPMAGHPIRDKTHEEQMKADYDKLISLIQEHDAIFLLMDTRESRWLPTLLGKFYGKIVLNAALGFDTFVVMRHGVRPEVETDDDESEEAQAKKSTSSEPVSELGCYFCNDVVAPADSVRDQTLDQMCTVTRPGIAAIASALLVELFVSILQHPQLGAAPAPASADADRGSHPLGVVPHQLRGFLFNFQNKMIHAPGYVHCSACSNKILTAFDDGGWDFVKRAMNETGFIEEVSGLAEVQRAAAAVEGELDWSDEDAGDGEGEMI
ncbi:hypothetical protein Dda_4866 [Drechslerella dactyloides]|uniref:Ubiquitin-like modifier-activating enzyme ATG7 n=1 Tax=Drechslerella dactyloides TaxID=74499 RepID=A0AAD6IXQ2_DREDA|nr:hypothetical protein Dda_4866 [Drechslerella dactyloides]